VPSDVRAVGEVDLSFWPQIGAFFDPFADEAGVASVRHRPRACELFQQAVERQP
jgi:hypothetical protein